MPNTVSRDKDGHITAGKEERRRLRNKILGANAGSSEHGAGKGDASRVSNKTAYELGLAMIKVDPDSDEFKELEKQWREALGQDT